MRKYLTYGGAVMKEILTILLLLCIGFAFSVTPTSIQDTIQIGEIYEYTISIYNSDNYTAVFWFNKTGETASWITFDQSIVQIPENSTADVTFHVFVPDSIEEGTYEGEIAVVKEGESKIVQLSFDVIKWTFENSYWFQEGQTITIQPFNFVFSIDSVSRDVITTVGNFSVGDSREFADGNIELTLLDRYENQARFMIKTTDPSTTVNVQTVQVQQEESVCRIEPLINKYMKSIQEGITTKLIWTIRNTGTETVELKDVITQDTIETVEGSKPIDVQGTLGKLNPGEETTLTVTIDSRNMELGTYTPSLIVIGYCGNVRTEAKIDFTIKIIKSLKPESYEINISYPREVAVNEPFSIKLTNVPEDAAVTSSEPAGIVKTGLTRSGTTITWNGKATSTGTYWILFTISTENKVETKIAQINVKEQVASSPTGNFIININPINPAPGTAVSVSAVDALSGMPVQASFTIKVKDKNMNVVDSFAYTGPFTVQAGYTYCVVATTQSGTLERCFTPMLKKLKIDISPSNPVEGDTVTIQILDQTTNSLVKDATITINGEVFTENPLEIPYVSAGEATIEASAPNYATTSVKITIAPTPELISKPEKYLYGKVVYWTFSGEVPWKIEKDGEVIDSGRSNNVTITLNQEGHYKLFIGTELIDEFDVKKGLLSNLPSLSLPSVIKTVLGILVLLVLIGLFGGKRTMSVSAGKKKYGRVAAMRPQKPPASTPITEEEEETE